MKHLFSLVELLIVVSVLLILASLFTPSLMRTISMAYTTQCQAQLRTVFVGISQYAEDHSDQYPGAASFWNSAHFTKGSYTFQNHLSHYLHHINIPNRWNNPLYYLPALACPSNKEVDIPRDWKTRSQFVQGVVNRTNDRPFGIRETRNDPEVPSLYRHEIDNPEKAKSLTDVYSPYWATPDLPVHYGYTVNGLFLDGHTENLHVNF